MKQVNGELNDYLNSERHLDYCDLYLLSLKNGDKYYIADYDKDIEYEGHTWHHNLFLMGRDQVKMQGEPSVDSLSVTIKCDRRDLIGGVPFMQACHSGVLDDGQLALFKAYLKDGELVGVFKFFEGFTEVTSAGGLGIKLTVKSIIQGLSQEIPVRVFAPQSAYVNKNGTIATSPSDSYSLLIPLKPSMKVLVRV